MMSIRWQLKIAAGVMGVLLFGLAAFNYYRVYCGAPVQLKLSGGNVCPLRTELARSICSRVEDSGVVLQREDAGNSEMVCAAVDKGELDLGLVLGGLPSGRHRNVRQVAEFGVEPLHLLVRREHVQGNSPTLEVLRGRRVSLGERGTNGAMLAESLMKAAGFKPTNTGNERSYVAEYAHESDLQSALQAVKKASPEERATFTAILPDAVFLVDSMPSPLVDELVATGLYQLVPLPYATALHFDRRRDRTRRENQLENSRLEAVTIPAFTYGINPAMPAGDCQTVGLRLLLIANRKTPAAAVMRLLQALEEAVSEEYCIDFSVAEQVCEFPIHDGAEAFAAGRKPILVGEVLEPVGNALSVFGAGAAGALGLWGFVRGLRRVNPDFHLRQIDRIERLLRGDEHDASAPTLPHDFVEYLERRLADIKKAAIDDYAAGRLDGDDALVGILTLIADTRQLLMERRKQTGQQDSHIPPRSNRLANAA